jgi:tetratricopeptide (TPR) repeat protein
LEVSPEDDLSHAALGYCAEIRGDRDQALRMYSKALILNPENLYARVRKSELEAEDRY